MISVNSTPKPPTNFVPSVEASRFYLPKSFLSLATLTNETPLRLLTVDRDDWVVRARLVRLWEGININNDDVMSLDMLLVDAESKRKKQQSRGKKQEKEEENGRLRLERILEISDKKDRVSKRLCEALRFF